MQKIGSKIKQLFINPFFTGCIFLVLVIAFFLQQIFISNQDFKKTNYANDAAEKIYQNCLKEDKQNCYKNHLKNLVKSEGLTQGEKILYLVQEKDEEAKNCHVIAHYMAREAYNRSPEKFDGLMHELNVNACGSGFLHGVLEAYMVKYSLTEIGGKFADEICSKKSDPYWQRMCAHFMGHIFLVYSEGNTQQALVKCDELRQGWQFDCYDGLFMEDHQKLALAEHKISPLPTLSEAYLSDLAQKCEKHAGQKRSACWTEMAEMYAHFYGYIPDKIFRGCNLAKNQPDRDTCYNKGIIVMAVFKGFESKEKLLSICNFYKNDPVRYQTCVYMQISGFMYYSPKYTERGITLCSNIPENYKNWCFTELGTRLKAIVPDSLERKNLCNTANGEYKALCVKEY